MQVETSLTRVELVRIQRLRLNFDELLSNFAIKFNLHRYMMGEVQAQDAEGRELVVTFTAGAYAAA